MSLSEKERSARMMNLQERLALLDAGWPAPLIDSLRERGFREAGGLRHDDGSTSPSFLRQTTLPHLHIAVEKTTTLEELDTAIFDAGMQHEREMARMKWDQFFRHITSPRTSSALSLECRLAKLEEKLSTP